MASRGWKGLKKVTYRLQHSYKRLDFSTPSNANISFIPSSNVMIWGGGTKGKK